MKPIRLAQNGNLRVAISRRIFADLQVRSPNPDGCWRGIDSLGVHWLPPQQLREMVVDCAYQGNIGGKYIDPLSSGLTRAYRALHAQLTKMLDQFDRYTGAKQ